MSDVRFQSMSRSASLRKTLRRFQADPLRLVGDLVFITSMPSEKVCNFRRVGVRIPERLLAVGSPPHKLWGIFL
jgi:hypothetical protein